MTPGATLLGVIGEDGNVAWAPPGVVVDKEFVRVASQGRDPLRRFRFSNACVERGCGQWKGDHCGVVEAVITHSDLEGADAEPLPACAIRAECRWYRERGAAACAVCAEVVTNQYVEAKGA
jgi:hypothetical protein